MKFLQTLFIYSLLFVGYACQTADDLTLYVGTYTGTGSTGIYTLTFNQSSGKWALIDSVQTGNPSYLTLAGKDCLYSVNEYADERSGVSTFRREKHGHLTLLGEVANPGADPCYIVERNGIVYTANYTSGSMSIYATENDGVCTKEMTERTFHNGSNVDTIRQASSHIHTVMPSPDNRFLFVTDLGGDCIYRFDLNPFRSNTESARIELPQGCGPRHIAFSKDAQMMYVVTELSDEVLVFHYAQESGELTMVQTVGMGKAEAHGGGDIHISPDGRYLYATKRLVEDGIAIYQINENGLLKSVGYQQTGIHPRNFTITPNGTYILVACRNSNLIQIFKRDANTGLLEEVDKIDLPEPVCLIFDEYTDISKRS